MHGTEDVVAAADDEAAAKDTEVIVIVVDVVEVQLDCIIVAVQFDSVITAWLVHADKVVVVVVEDIVEVRVVAVAGRDVVGVVVEEVDKGVEVTTQEQAELIFKVEEEHPASQLGIALIAVSAVARYGPQKSDANVG
jgi:hypothetical protein